MKIPHCDSKWLNVHEPPAWVDPKAMVSWFVGWRIFLEPFLCSRSVENKKLKKFASGIFFRLQEIPSRSVGIRKIFKKNFYFEVYIWKTILFCTSNTKVAVSLLIMARFSIRKKFLNLWVGRHLKNKTERLFYFSIGPKIGTSVAPPTYKSTDHGLILNIITRTTKIQKLMQKWILVQYVNHLTT